MAKKAITGSIIDADKAKNYKVSAKVKTASGRKAVDCDDAVAKQLRGKNDEELAKIAREAGVIDRWKGWDKLNPGQRRMALGNVLRGLKRNKSKPAKKAA